MHKDSIYNKILIDLEERQSMGYNYSKGGVLQKFLSPLFYGNPRMSIFLNKLDEIFIELIESVKRIQYYTNYTIDKNDRRFNS